MTLNEFLDFISSGNPSAASKFSIITTKAAGNNMGIISAHKNFRPCIQNILNARKLKRLIQKNNYQYQKVRTRCFWSDPLKL